MITTIMGLMIIRPLMIMMTVNLFSLSLSDLYISRLLMLQWRRGRREERKSLTLIIRHASAKMHAFISAINSRAVSVASRHAPTLTHTHSHLWAWSIHTTYCIYTQLLFNVIILWKSIVNVGHVRTCMKWSADWLCETERNEWNETVLSFHKSKNTICVLVEINQSIS